MDYSRFDHIDTDSDDEEVKLPSSAVPLPTKVPSTSSVKGKGGRLQYSYEGRVIYEWEQSLEEVNIFINPPPNVAAQHLQIGKPFRTGSHICSM